MDKLIMLFLMARFAEGFLPEGARPVDSCPEANNITAWIEASKKLGCSDYSSKSIKNKKLYHCLPSSFLNETIEFCGFSAAIPRGKCPIYNYENGATVATSHSCANFTNGCPSRVNPYHSNSFYKYFACWNINKKSKCYYADKNCQKDEKSYQTTMPNNQDTENSFSTTLYQTTTLNDQYRVSESSIPVWIVIILVIVIVILFAVIVVVLVCFRDKLHQTNSKDINDDQESQPLNKKECEEPCFPMELLTLDEKRGQPMDDIDQEKKPLDKIDKYKDIDKENEPLDRMDKYQNVDPEKELLNDIEEDKGPGNVKKEAFGTDKIDKDVDKDEDKNLASENSRLRKDIDQENETLDKIDKYKDDDQEKELFNDIEEDKGPGNVKKDAFGTYKRDKDVDKDDDKNLASENSRLRKELSDVENRSEIEDVAVENMVTVEYKAIKSEKLRDENPKEDDDKPEKQDDNDHPKKKDECLQCCMEANDLRSLSTRKSFIEIRDTGSGKAKEDKLAFNAFYHDLATKIMDDEKIMSSFRVLLDLEPIEHTVNANEMNLFHQWNKEHKFFFNIWHLQELLKKSKAENLVQECEKFAEKRLPSMKLCYFSRKIKDDGREILIIHTSYDIHDESTRGYMEKIREQLSDRLKKPKSDIKLEGIEEGSLMFLFSLSKLNIKDFLVLSFVRSLWLNGVLKVETNDFIIVPDFRVVRKGPFSSSIWSSSPRRLTDTNYREGKRKLKQVVVRFRTSNPHFEDGIKMSFNTILKNLRKCFKRLPSNNKVFGELATVEINLGLSPKVLLYSGCRNASILEDMEPSTVLHLLKEQLPKLYWLFENSVKSENSRSKRAKNLIDCLSYFMDYGDILNCVYGKKRVLESGKEHQIKRTENQKREVMVKESIISNWNFLLEELDSSIIKETLEAQTYTEEGKPSLQENSGMSRRDRVESFLQFILKNDEYLVKFDDVLHKHDLIISHSNTNHLDISASS